MAKVEIPEEVEEYRDERWRRAGTRQVESVQQAERFIEEVGFAACLTDSRRPGPSLYVAVCGRRDAVMPRNVQKDPEASQTWLLKDDIIRRGKVYYAKLARGKAMFIAPRMIPYFHAIWGMKRSEEKSLLSPHALAILRVLRKEWEMSTSDLRADAGVKSRAAFSKALDELQAAMLVIPSEVYYQPKFTYIWTLGIGRFHEGLLKKVSRETALREIARCFLSCAGLTIPGELARVVGVSRPEAGRGNRALVADGYATTPASGFYRLTAPLATTFPSDSDADSDPDADPDLSASF
jgi:DNA-binding transcriptional ArsR family regulator